MITRLSLHGFKCFVNQEFRIAPLTFLSGLNSSGKSSILQALNILSKKQSEIKHTDLKKITSTHAKSFTIEASTDHGDLTFSYNKNSDDIVEHPSGALSISYISAARLGPKLYQTLSPLKEIPSVGKNGTYTLDYLSHYKELSSVPTELQKSQHSDNVIRVLEDWLSVISPGVEFDFSIADKAEIATCEYSHRRPVDVGFGLSYVLPILAQIIVDVARHHDNPSYSPILLLENPEAHLHPAGQTQMGLLLAKATQSGLQIIVESHSDHVLNGIRLAVKNGHTSPENTQFYFLEHDFDEEESTVENPQIKKDGGFDFWPDGFFDEMEKSLFELI